MSTKQKQPNLFINLIDHIMGFDIGDIITRKSLFTATNTVDTSYNTTVDNYRNKLTVCGYLKHAGSGNYRLIKKIPENYNTEKLKREYEKINRTNQKGSYGTGALPI